MELRVLRGSWVLMPVAAALLLLLAACSESEPTGIECSGVGCANGLQVNFNRVPPLGTVVILEFGQTPWRVECGTDADCSNGLFFEGLLVDYVAVRVTTAEGGILHELRPEYVETRPNGPDCPPTCWNATVTVALPADA